MSSDEQQVTSSPALSDASADAPLGLESALEATKAQRDAIQAKLPKARKEMDAWWQALIGEATAQDFKMEGTALRTIDRRIAEIDEELSKQLSEVMHHPEFQKLEGTWAGLRRFVFNTEVTKGELEIDVLDCSKEELAEDFRKAGKPHDSELYKKTVKSAYQVFGGVPFGTIIADYEWTGHPADIATLTDFAKVASGSHTSIITSPSPELFGKDSWEQLAYLDRNHFAEIFEAPESIEWRNFRKSEESRYVTMAMPRTMARLPFGQGPSNIAIKEFRFEELPLGDDGENIEAEHDRFCWSNAAYALGERITESFFVYGWTTSISGVTGGGLVRDLPLYKYKSPHGDTKVKCPTELVLGHDQEYALSERGFCSIQYILGENQAVFAGGQTVHQPQKVQQIEAQSSENLSARLPYILAVSRVTHFCKAIAHEKIGDFLERKGCERWLNNWIMEYVEKSENPSDELKRKKPFKNASIKVQDKPGDPGFYQVEILLAPWIKFEGMTADITLVADVERATAERNASS